MLGGVPIGMPKLNFESQGKRKCPVCSKKIQNETNDYCSKRCMDKSKTVVTRSAAKREAAVLIAQFRNKANWTYVD